MTILTDEIVEKAARAAWAESQKIEHDPKLPMTWDEEIPDQMRAECRQLIRATLEAALPDILEACADKADAVANLVRKTDMPPPFTEADTALMRSSVKMAGLAIATDIRALVLNPKA